MDSYSDQANPDETPEIQQAKFSMNQERAAEYVIYLTDYPRHKQICMCGHSINSHSYAPSSGYRCQSGNIWCECSKPHPAFFASDARLFKRSTHGYGKSHALGLGIASLQLRGGTGEWITEMKCSVSDCAELELTVACLDKNNNVVPKSTSNSVLLCHKHTWDLGGWRL